MGPSAAGSTRCRGWRDRSARLAVALLLAVAACGGGDDEASEPTADTSTTAGPPTTAPPPTTSPATSTTVAPTTATTTTTTITTTTTTAPPADPVDACEAYLDGIVGLLDESAAHLENGVGITERLAAGTLLERDAAPQLAAISEAFGQLVDELFALGEPPALAVPVTALVGESLELFQNAYELQSQAAANGDAALIDQGTAALQQGSDLLAEVPDALPDCSVAGAPATPTEPAPTDLASPAEVDLRVFFRLAESLLADTAYAGTSPEQLTAGAQAACSVLLTGGDLRGAIEAAVAATPAAGQSFGADEQSLVLLLVTRGVPLWCPSVVTDEEAFTADVISTIVDVFFDS